jgi:hypothetical protein
MCGLTENCGGRERSGRPSLCCDIDHKCRFDSRRKRLRMATVTRYRLMGNSKRLDAWRESVLAEEHTHNDRIMGVEGSGAHRQVT